jgi:hypothetical protein
MKNAVTKTGHTQSEGGAKEAPGWFQGTSFDVGFSVFVLLLSVVLGAAYGNAMFGSIIGILGALAVWAILKEIQFHRRRDSRSILSNREEGL